MPSSKSSLFSPHPPTPRIVGWHAPRCDRLLLHADGAVAPDLDIAASLARRRRATSRCRIHARSTGIVGHIVFITYPPYKSVVRSTSILPHPSHLNRSGRARVEGIIRRISKSSVGCFHPPTLPPPQRYVLLLPSSYLWAVASHRGIQSDLDIYVAQLSREVET